MSRVSVGRARRIGVPSIPASCRRASHSLRVQQLVIPPISLVLAEQRRRVLRNADKAYQTLLNEIRRGATAEMTVDDDGCPNPHPSGSVATMLPVETWVGGTIRVLSNNSMIVQVRDGKQGIPNPMRFCGFGGAALPGEDPSQTYIREYREELLGCNIFDAAVVNMLRLCSVETPRGVAIRVVLDMIIPHVPLGLYVGEGVGYLSVAERDVERAFGFTQLSLEDAKLSRSRGPAAARYVLSIKQARAAFPGIRLDEDVFGAESGEPYDQY